MPRLLLPALDFEMLQAPHTEGCLVARNNDFRLPLPLRHFRKLFFSASKVFSLALALEKHNISYLLNKIGNRDEKHSFNSIYDVIHTPNHTINSFVNAGAMATTSLLYDRALSKENNEKQIEKDIRNSYIV